VAENETRLTQHMCHKMILFQNDSTINDKSNKNAMFLSFYKLYWFLYEAKDYKIKFRFVVYVFQNLPLCSSTVFFSAKVYGGGF
jgi:hypothetical protein